ncbi:BREX-1 system adenine-specific DNA-methyltransferase PglX [Pleomorphochaeta sp. DL1XJH-081]|uniref:BREX-1 system adenine-specific DNA-methyltransferase PglX n=1 Tax=Pleomorphochaeta sp. DL1XJH-081 TaxID=3409690 RepID=UPI003BB4D58F
MAFDQSTRNRLQKFVSESRSILTEEFTRQLQAIYGMDPKNGSVAEMTSLSFLDNQGRQTAIILRETLEHYKASLTIKSEKERNKQGIERIIREQSFTVLNRFGALRMAEARGFLLESIANGYSSKGFQLYKNLAGSALGETGDAYQQYLFSIFDEFSQELAALFDRNNSQGLLFPRESAFLSLLNQINHFEIEHLWTEDETIGWIYQYFNTQEERRKMRVESQAPRNGRELAVRNQFFTPRYVVEFLTDNTLGKIWYEMTQGKTSLVEKCRYLVRHPNEIFLAKGESAPENESEDHEKLSQEELLKQPVYIPFRELKDPRELRMLDPACGSMHFGLYAFDLFEKIYEEAWQLETELGLEAFCLSTRLKPLQATYSSFKEYQKAIPKLIIECNIHGVDIDPRAVQIAGLSLWQRAQRAWHQIGIKPNQRPTIKKSNIVCAEPMPGEKEMLLEFTSNLYPPVLGQLVETIFDKMKLAGEAGTLLKIEEEIASTAGKAKDEFYKELLYRKEEQGYFPGFAPKREAAFFDFTELADGTSFWDTAEESILGALSAYADQAVSGDGQKRLFAEDAAKGFAFIDLCRKQFDIMLQNPPFGEPAKQSKTYIDKCYPSCSRDILQAFVERLLTLSTPNGVVGTLSARTGFFLGDSKHWRNNVVFKNRLELFADLGLGVLDDALVEVAAYVIGKGEPDGVVTYATRHLSTRDKETALGKDVDKLVYNFGKGSNFIPFKQALIQHIPDYTFAYWAPQNLIRRYPNTSTFLESIGKVRQGIATADDFRFARLSWEVASENIGKDKRWVRFSKGGEYSPPYDDVHLLVDWGDGKQLGAFDGARFQNVNAMFHKGVTYTVRTASAFAGKILPEGCVFSHNAQTWQHKDDKHLLSSIAYMMCRVPQTFIELGVGSGDIATAGSAARRYTTAVIEGVPIQNLGVLTNETSQSLIKQVLDAKLIELSFDETSADFKNLFVHQDGKTLNEITEAVKSKILRAKEIALYASFEIDKLVTNSFNLNSIESDFVDSEVGVHPCNYTKDPDVNLLDYLQNLDEEALINKSVELHGAKRYFTKKSYFVDRRIEILAHALQSSPKKIIEILQSTLTGFETKEVAKSILSECIGIAFKRWSKKVCTTELREPFAPLPNIAPAALSDFADNGAVPESTHTGIMVIDELSPLNLCAIIEKELSSIKNESLLDECLIDLGAKNLATYFSTPKFFFSDHLSRYSKSRRQAPIYWPLQTPSGSYTLWVYYHRLTEQTLYTCVNDFLEGPKGKLTEVSEALNELRNKSARSGAEEQDLARFSDLEAELKDFRDELLRLSKFWKPNLNDGVQITAAPLWKLFQHKQWQKKLKETWEKLERGDYDWAHLAYSIWPERVLRKCHEDRSLAIAHDVESDFWEEVEIPVIRQGKDTGGIKVEWHPKKLNENELKQIITQKIAELK